MRRSAPAHASALSSADGVAPATFFGACALSCAAGVIAVLVLRRSGSPVTATLIALGTQFVLYSIAARRGRWDSVLVEVLGVVALAMIAQTGCFFGTSSAFAAVVAVVLAIIGLVVPPARFAWLAYVVIALGQFAVTLAIATGAMVDRSLLDTVNPPLSVMMAAHVVLQGVYAIAFVSGRMAQRRYRRLIDDMVEATRRVAIREALVDEAIAEHARALAIRDLTDAVTERGIDAATTAEATTQSACVIAEPLDAMPRRHVPRAATARIVVDDGSLHSWLQAYHSRTRSQDALAIALCLAGVVLIAAVIRDDHARDVALISVWGITLAIAARNVLARRANNAFVNWPYDLVCVLILGPAYALGLHSGFVAVIAVFLLGAGLFRAASPTTLGDRHHVRLLLAMLGYALTFAAIAGGAVPDGGLIPVMYPGTTYEPVVVHLVVQALFVVAYVVGTAVDRRFTRVYERVRAAQQTAAGAAARLFAARADLDAVLRRDGRGLFSATQIGPYRVGALLGRGGMGEVYEAQRGSERIALKLVRAEHLGDRAALERFEREARILMQIASPYCARVLDIACDHTLPYLAMEHVDGPSLATRLRDREQLDAADLAGLVHDVTRGLADIHASGVVHLDLKPSNLVEGTSPLGKRWRIVDFGIARTITGSDTGGAIAGTPGYMAPEQARGDAVDARTDLYALAAILFRAITGRPAFVSERIEDAKRMQANGPPDPHDLVAIDDDLALVLRIGLAFDPRDRFATAAELGAAFTAALTGRLDERTRARGRDLLARQPWPASAASTGSPQAATSTG